eukprot:gb/GEZN01005175.1/.p1 GENE.gb/GEZN01005175.1/~~gb/GEZN01005175.1/.p1  ORF type:complete len:576 (-),score=96.48 gb/GEZN01005175.1/:114-1814(-)
MWRAGWRSSKAAERGWIGNKARTARAAPLRLSPLPHFSCPAPYPLILQTSYFSSSSSTAACSRPNSSLSQPTIASILQSVHKGQKGEVTVQGWLRSARVQSHVAFLTLNDGSCLNGLQLVLTDPKNMLPKEGVPTGSSVRAVGEIVEVLEKPGQFEIQAKRVIITGAVGAGYPLHKARLPIEYLREIPHLRARSNVIGAVLRLRSAAHQAVHSFLQRQEFLMVHTPILTPLDCEGAGELFQVHTKQPTDSPSNSPSWSSPSSSLLSSSSPSSSAGPSSSSSSGACPPVAEPASFFPSPCFLNVSGQLYAEIAASAAARVYTFGPTFRAEHSHSSRHLAEFWMIEPEVAFADVSDVMLLAQHMVQDVCISVCEQLPEDMSFFDKRIQPGLVASLQTLSSQPFAYLSYTEAIDILLRSKMKFEFPVEWGNSLQSEHEQYLATEYCKSPVFVTHYPRKVKAFYMRADQSGPLDLSSRQTSACFDLLIPRIGELAGGSQREEREDQLVLQLLEHKLDPAQYEWYVQLRRFGTVPHSGFGMGFERLLRLLSGMANVRDLTLVPRYHGHLRF